MAATVLRSARPLATRVTVSAAAPQRAVHVEGKLKELMLVLPNTTPPAGRFPCAPVITSYFAHPHTTSSYPFRANHITGTYVPAVRTGNLIFLAGHLPWDKRGQIIAGRVDQDLDVPTAYEAAKLVTLGLLATLKRELGDLDKVRRIVKVTGLVNAGPGFTQHPQVINGCSDLLVAVFGEKGRHARVAAGYSSLPLNAAVEIDLIAEVE